MNEWNRNLVEQFSALPRNRQIMLVATAVGSLSFFLWISIGMGGQEFSPLYRGLDTDQTALIADALREQKIDYRLENGGSTISVPVADVPEARIRIAAKGLPGGASSGFELFDRPAFGVTDFVHRVNFIRAVQGELTRSVEQLEPVERARVQVVIPEKSSVLASRKRKPSAAVVVRLVPGRELDRVQTRAIVHLVASSIESLKPADVTVVDSAGRLLAPVGDETSPGTLPAGGAPAHQARVEAELANRIETMLEPVVGLGGVVARVSADMNWTESKVTEERFDPDSQIARSESRVDEFEALPEADGGAPGVEANTPEGSTASTPRATETDSDDPGRGSTRTTETLNYEISKTVSQRMTAMGAIERLSVAVLVDSEPRGAGGPAEGQEGDPAPRWTPEDLKQFEELAREAVGYSEERGDRIVVSAAPFRTPDLQIESEGFALDPQTIGLLSQAGRFLVQLFALFLFVKFVAKPLVAFFTTAPETASAPDAPSLPASVAELEAAGLPGAARSALAGASASASLPMPGADPGRAMPDLRNEESVMTIRNWLNQE